MTFQSNEREIDIALARQQYRTDIHLLNDFLYHVGSYEIHIIQAIPDKKLTYAMIITPFDAYIWMYIGIAVVAVMISFVAIEKTSAHWTKLPKTDLAYLSTTYSFVAYMHDNYYIYHFFRFSLQHFTITYEASRS